MSRKAENNVKMMDNEVIRCFIQPEGHPKAGKEVTTQAERAEVARQWCAGDYSHHYPIAEKHGLLPIALLIAALIDINHPLLNSGRGTCFNSIQCAVIILTTMHRGETVAQPFENSIHSQLVERINK